jgi:hypothetical protein
MICCSLKKIQYRSRKTQKLRKRRKKEKTNCTASVLNSLFLNSSLVFFCVFRVTFASFATGIFCIGIKKAPASGAFGERGALSCCRDVHGVLVQSAFVGEAHVACCQGKQGVIFTDAHVHTGVELGATLAHDDSASGDEFTTESFHTEHFGL